MPTMRQRHTHSHTHQRRSHHALKTQIFGLCDKCGQSVLPHRVCLNCGTYQGREIVDVLKKLTKKEKKDKQKEMAEQEKQTKGMDMESLSVK